MTTILLAEDSPTQAALIEIQLVEAGYEVTRFPDGAEAWESIQQQQPDLVLTDLNMPEMNGLELVEAIHDRFPILPVILVTADGTEDLAVRALQAGAASYIPKDALSRDLIPTMEDVLDLVMTRTSQDRLLSSIVEQETVYELENCHNIAAAMVRQVEEELENLRLCDSAGVFRVSLAFKEALANAIDHGNLELDSEMRDVDDAAYRELGETRRNEAPYADRQVRVSCTFDSDRLQFRITDEGPGFDPSIIPDPTDPENMTRAHGRGLMLIQSFMDEVVHNETGNEITMVKYRELVSVDGNGDRAD